MRRIISLLGGRRGVLALVVAAVGLALIGSAWRAQVNAPQPRPQGRISVAGTVSTDHGGTPRQGKSSHQQAGSSRTTARATSEKRGPLGPSRPVRISIPAIGVHSAGFPIGKTPQGRLAVPQPGPRLNDVAWYQRSPTPGQSGPSVLLGHVDSVEGPSVFFRLGDVRPGDQVRIRRQDGITVVFTVNAVRDFKKARFPSRLVYGGPDLSTPQLRLITCSDYVESIHHHIGDEVVFANLTSVRRAKHAAAFGAGVRDCRAAGPATRDHQDADERRAHPPARLPAGGMMSDDLHTLSGAYALNAVEAEEAREFERHLSGCEPCRDEVRELRETAAAMGAAEVESPPASLRARVLHSAARQPQLPPVVAHLDGAKKRRRLIGLVAAAAAVLAVIAGVVTTQVQHGQQLSQPVAAVFHAPDSQTVQLTTSNGGTLTVAVSRRMHEMAVDTHQLPALSNTQVYQLWEIVGGHAQSAGLVGNPQGGQAMPLPPRSSQVAITIEPAGGSRQPTTKPIVVLRPSQV